MWGSSVSDHADRVIHQVVEADDVGRSRCLPIGDEPPAVRERCQCGIDDRAANGFQHHVDGGAIVGFPQPVGVYKHSEGRPLLGRKLAGKSQREMRDLGLVVEDAADREPGATG
jgi:hypothetical protein